MYISRFYDALAQIDDAAWQAVLKNHSFWRAKGSHIDEEHQDIAFHILMHDGELGDHLQLSEAAFEFDAVAVPPQVFQDEALTTLVQQWSQMHALNFGPGLTIKMGLYVIRAGGTLGFHIDGPVFLKGMRADLSSERLQRGLIELQASHRTILPLRFNLEDRFMVCGFRAPLQRGEFFEFNNVLPHAYFNCGPEHAVLLVTTYLEEALLPAEFDYRSALPV